MDFVLSSLKRSLALSTKVSSFLINGPVKRLLAFSTRVSVFLTNFSVNRLFALFTSGRILLSTGGARPVVRYLKVLVKSLRKLGSRIPFTPSRSSPRSFAIESKLPPL